MARKSRKNPDIQDEILQTKEIIFNTAIYARLSLENKDKDNCSIDTQVEISKQFLEHKPQFELSGIFADNGFTGTNFQRPKFLEMLEAIRRGKINCLVVKDLSRFGREYIEVCNYILNLFPLMGVRFISVNDNLDTFDENFDKEILIVALKSLVHDMYAKDISMKIKSSLETRRKKGLFTGNIPPYGYLLSKEDKGKLIIDKNTMPVVKDIFQRKLDGQTDSQIVRYLNNSDILSPKNYGYSIGRYKSQRYEKRVLWCEKGIKSILTNPIYLGNMVQGKSRISTQKTSKIINVPKEEWVVVENTHEAIIELNVFNAVSEIHAKTNKEHLKHYGKYSHLVKPPNILQGIFFCGHCGSPMHFHRRKLADDTFSTSYCCINCRRTEQESKFISGKIITEAIKKMVEKQMNTIVEFHQVICRFNHSDEVVDRKQQLKKDITVLKQRITKLNSMLGTLYNDYSDGVLTKDEYAFAKESYLNEQEQATYSVNEKTLELQSFRDEFTDNNKWSEILEKFKQEKVTEIETIIGIIDKIELMSNKVVHITFSYQDEYNQLFKLAERTGEVIL